jgi:hypothetical protein
MVRTVFIRREPRFQRTGDNEQIPVYHKFCPEIRSEQVPDDTLVALGSTGQIATAFEEIPLVTWLGCISTARLNGGHRRLEVEETLLTGEWFMSLGQPIPTR